MTTRTFKFTVQGTDDPSDKIKNLFKHDDNFALHHKKENDKFIFRLESSEVVSEHELSKLLNNNGIRAFGFSTEFL